MTEPVLPVEIFADVACPWCWVAERRFAAGLARFEHRDRVRVTHRAFELDPGAPIGSGESAEAALARVRQVPVETARTMIAQVTSTARRLGLSYDFDRLRPANTFDAHRLVHGAREHGLADDVLQALFAAHLEQGVAVDDRAELVRIGVEAGLSARAAAAALTSPRTAAAVRADRALAAALGITSIPFVLVDRRVSVAGARREDVMLDALREAWPPRGQDD